MFHTNQNFLIVLNSILKSCKIVCLCYFWKKAICLQSQDNNYNQYTTMSIQEIIQRDPNSKCNTQRQKKLLSLMNYIPHNRKSSLTINLLFEYALNIDHTHSYSYVKKENSKNFATVLKKDIEEGKLQISKDQEPLEKFLVTAIIKNKNWQEIIEENKLNYIFITNHKRWIMREAWILFLCFTGFTEKQAYVIIFRLTQRQRRSVKKIYMCAKELPYFQKKLTTWLSKSQQQLLHIYDDDERNLLIAVSSKATFADTLRLLKDNNQLKLKNDEDKECLHHWISFLCSKCQGNNQYEYPDIEWNMESVTWILNPLYLRKKLSIIKKNELKLAEILEQYHQFDQYFTDEVEIILLKAIKNKVKWQKTKEDINALFSKVENAKTKSKRKDNIQINRRILPRQLTDDQEMNGGSLEFTNIYSQSLKPEKKPLKRQRAMSQAQQVSDIRHRINNQFEQDEVQNKTELVYYNMNDETVINQKETIKQTTFDLNKEQKMVLSMLEKGRQYLNQVENAYFQSIPTQQLHLFALKSKSQIAPIAQDQLNYYRLFPETITSIEDSNVKTLVRTLLIATAPKEEKIVKDQPQPNKCDEEDEDLSILFVKGYNKIVQQLGLSNNLLVDVEKKNQKEFKEEEQ